MSEFILETLLSDGTLPPKARADLGENPPDGFARYQQVEDLAARVDALGGAQVRPAAASESESVVDATDMIRDLLTSLDGKPGTVHLPAGDYYIGGGSVPAGAAFTLATGQRIEGAGTSKETNGRTVLWVDDNTQQSSHLVRSDGTSGIGVTGLTFETRCKDLGDASFRDPVFLRQCSDFELSYNTKVSGGVGFQFDVNIKANAGTAASTWGRNGRIHDCRFTALTEFHSTHDMLVERCEWNIDRAQIRPAWLRGATQTAFKFSGNWSAMTGAKLRDCIITMYGTGERFEPFELVRCPGVLLERLSYKGIRPDVPCNIQMSTPKVSEMGLIEGQMDVLFRSCDFGNLTMYVRENVALTAKQCKWTNTEAGPFNAVTDGYNPAEKQATTVFPNEITFEGCEFKGGGRVLAATTGGSGLYRFLDSTIDYDNWVYAQGISINGAGKTLIMTGCRIRMRNTSNGAAVAAYLRDIGRAELVGIMITNDPGVTTTGGPIWLGGSGQTNVSGSVLLHGGTKLLTKESSYTGTVTGE